jgi:hypothetical protein
LESSRVCGLKKFRGFGRFAGLDISRVLAWQVLGEFEGASLAGAWKVCVVVGCECALVWAAKRARMCEAPCI